MIFDAVAKRSCAGPRARLRSPSPRCGAIRRFSPVPSGARSRKTTASRAQMPTNVTTKTGPALSSGAGTDAPSPAARLAGHDCHGLRAGRGQRELLARAGGGDVRDLPRAPELLRERGVDRLERAGLARALIAAARLLGQPLKRRGPEARALDRDRIDGHLGVAGRLDHRRQAGVARDLLAVREQDEDTRRRCDRRPAPGRRGARRRRAPSREPCRPGCCGAPSRLQPSRRRSR